MHQLKYPLNNAVYDQPMTTKSLTIPRMEGQRLLQTMFRGQLVIDHRAERITGKINANGWNRGSRKPLELLKVCENKTRQTRNQTK